MVISSSAEVSALQFAQELEMPRLAVDVYELERRVAAADELDKAAIAFGMGDTQYTTMSLLATQGVASAVYNAAYARRHNERIESIHDTLLEEIDVQGEAVFGMVD